MFIQLLRSWKPGYDELPNPTEHFNGTSIKYAIAELERELESMTWTEDETSEQSEPKMHQLCAHALAFLTPLAPRLTKDWGSLVLNWGTARSIRVVAFHSLQIFRTLMP
jgi:NADPH-dependent 7-cyano-7-deazaguanine reductase QueF